MYAEYYKLTAMPFQLTPDCQFFFGSREHSRAMAHLTYGLAQEEGFIVITGEIGAGKTMLVERLCSQLDQNKYVIVRILTTQISGDDLLRMTLTGCGISPSGEDKAAIIGWLEQHFSDQHRLGKRCLLIIDEVQNLPIAALEELRMLSNITIDGRAPFQAVLLGQPQFRTIFTAPDLEQLRQRVLASYHLGPLSEAETRAYIEHRLTTAGWIGKPLFEEAAFAAIHRRTGGVPRRINTLCSRLLLFGALDQASCITEAIANEVADELRQDLMGPNIGPSARLHPIETGDFAADLAGRLDRAEIRLERHDRILKHAVEIGLRLTEGHR